MTEDKFSLRCLNKLGVLVLTSFLGILTLLSNTTTAAENEVPGVQLSEKAVPLQDKLVSHTWEGSWRSARSSGDISFVFFVKDGMLVARITKISRANFLSVNDESGEVKLRTGSYDVVFTIKGYTFSLSDDAGKLSGYGVAGSRSAAVNLSPTPRTMNR